MGTGSFVAERVVPELEVKSTTICTAYSTTPRIDVWNDLYWGWMKGSPIVSRKGVEREVATGALELRKPQKKDKNQ